MCILITVPIQMLSSRSPDLALREDVQGETFAIAREQHMSHSKSANIRGPPLTIEEAPVPCLHAYIGSSRAYMRLSMLTCTYRAYMDPPVLTWILPHLHGSSRAFMLTATRRPLCALTMLTGRLMSTLIQRLKSAFAASRTAS